MQNPQQPIVVFGATGSQGKSVVKHLLTHSFRVRAVTRKPNGKQAHRLAQRGAEVVYGNLDDPLSILQAVSGAHGVYAVTDFLNNGVQKEIEHGKTMATAARSAGIRHFVLASGASANHAGDVSHMASKWTLEQFARSLRLPLTILRPALFMEDLHDPKYSPRIAWALMNTIIGMDRPLPWIAVDDIGAVAARVLSHPDAFLGRTLTLAGDRLSLRQCFYLFQKVLGRFPALLSLPICLARKIEPDLVAMWEWLRNHEMEGSPADLRSLLPGALTMESWLRQKVAQPEGTREFEGSSKGVRREFDLDTQRALRQRRNPAMMDALPYQTSI